MTHTGATIQILLFYHFAAVNLGELAKAIPPAYFETPASLGIRIGKGLTMDKTHQQLSLGDSPQVITMHMLTSYFCSTCCFESCPACALKCSTASLMQCLHAEHAQCGLLCMLSG